MVPDAPTDTTAPPDVSLTAVKAGFGKISLVRNDPEDDD